MLFIRSYFHNLLLLLFLTSVPLCGQNSYIVVGSEAMINVELIDGGDQINSSLIYLKEGNNSTKYTPYDVSEYGFKDGRVYISKDIVINGSAEKVFLQRLTKGKINLYYYRGAGVETYFIENEGYPLIELPKWDYRTGDSYKSYLRDITSDCSELNGLTSNLRYRKLYLAKFINGYNECRSIRLPNVRFGINAGLVSSRAFVQPGLDFSYLKDVNFTLNTTFYTGAFAEFPLHASNYSLVGEVGIIRSKLYYSGSDPYSYMVVYGNITRIVTPVYIKYSLWKEKNSFYFIAGPQFGFNISNDASAYEVNRLSGTVMIRKYNNGDLISFFQAGTVAGAGIEIPVKKDTGIRIECRYNLLFSTSQSSGLNDSAFQLSTGIIF